MISVYVRNCVDEIGQSVYGRDCRKPIHDAIQGIYDNGQGEAEEYRDDWASLIADLTIRMDIPMAQWGLFLTRIQNEWDSFAANVPPQAASGDGLHPPFKYM